MKKISILLLALMISISSCKQTPKLEYKYSDKENYFLCSEVDIDLYKEATYAFEDFILKNYDFRNTQILGEAYSNYLRKVEDNITPMGDRFDERMISILNALKAEEGLWSNNALNYNHEIMTCITNNLGDDDLKKIFSALLSSKTFKPNVVAPIINRNKQVLLEDKTLATYVALDMFYGKLLDIDFTVSKAEVAKQIVEKNASLHAGHNH